MLLKRQVFTKTKRTVFIIAFLALSLLHFAVFWCYINFDTIRLTFFKVNQYGEEIFVGGQNYAVLFKNIFGGVDKGSATSFWNSFHAVGINLIILPISIIVAYAFYKKVYGHTFYRLIFYLPSVISIVVLAAAFREMFRQYNDGFTVINGPVAQLLSALGINKQWLTPDVDTNVKWPLIYLFAILNGMGTNVILISSAMNRIPNFASVYSFFMQPMLILDYNTGVDNMFSTAPMQIFNLVADAGFDTQKLISAACLGIILTIIVLPLNLIMRAVLNRFTAEVSY